MSAYEDATFRIRIGPMVTVEISIHGCNGRQDAALPGQLQQVGQICVDLAVAIEEIKANAETQEKV